jgi:hypothetical protein
MGKNRLKEEMVYSCMKLILNIEPLEEDTYEGL